MKWFGPPASTYLQRVWIKGHVVMVPMYDHPELFVGPGYGTSHHTVWTEEDLTRAGFKPGEHELLSRLNMKELTR